ncbi:serpin family protein [Aureivirga sp. CE67]|uniref:serpin family protein n=1 Tax=Aureivirga sp. CE67 TaxID=1788983 RepID=UPI0018CB76B7|nr:serpin family protein [Aureivirga sp. CE67]
MPDNELENSISIKKGIVQFTSKYEKSFSFKHEFDKNELTFKNHKVKSFGCSSCKSELINQIEVLHYTDKNDFSIQLFSENTEDEIFLFKPKKKANSLKEYFTIFNQKRKKNSTQKIYFSENDVLKIPIIKFNLEQSFEELSSTKLLSKKDTLNLDYIKHHVAFLLDEKGAKIKSESSIGMKTEEREFQPKEFLFDKPFLIFFKNKNNEFPYFAVKIDNTEFMDLKTSGLNK